MTAMDDQSRYYTDEQYQLGFDANCLLQPFNKDKPKEWQEGWLAAESYEGRSEQARFA